MKVTVVGSANIDLVATASHLPRAGETVLGKDFSQVPGGKGANQAIAARRTGAEVTFIGAIGSDSFGVTLRARLQSSTVDTSLLRVVYGTSGVALIVVDETGENAIVVAPGANASLTSLTEADLGAIAAADVLLLQLEIPLGTVAAAAAHAHASGTRVLLNAAPARTLPDGLADTVDLLVVNQVEGAALAGVSPVGVDAVPDPAEVDPWSLVEALLERFPRVVLTRGAAGAWYGGRDSGPVHVAAPVVDAVDSTAAGDAFTAALAVAWGEGRELVEAVRWASAAGAVAACRPGASSALPTRSEVDELYTSAYH